LVQHQPETEHQPYMVVVSESNAPVAAALMPHPRNLILSCVDEPDAIPLIAHDMYAKQIMPPGVIGPGSTARAFAEEWQRLSGQLHRLQMAERIYKLEAVVPVTGVPGQMR